MAQENKNKEESSKQWYKKWWVWLIVIILVMGILGDDPENQPEPEQNNEEEIEETVENTNQEVAEEADEKTKELNSNVKPVSYEIIESKDNSMKALGNKELSDFTLQEMKNLPKNERRLYKIVIGTEISKKHIRPTVEKIISDITEKNPDIDEITLELYSTKDRAKGTGYDLAQANWSTNGDLGGITSEIARENVREDYEIKINIRKDDLEKYLEKISQESKTKFGLTEIKRKEFYNELVHCEDIAMRKARKKYSFLCSNCSEFIEADAEKEAGESKELAKECKKELRNQYNLTEEEQAKITTEAFEKSWPNPELPPEPDCCE